MRGLRHQPNRSRARFTGHRHGPGSREQARTSRPGGPQLRLQPEATAAAAAAPGDTLAPSEQEGWPGCSSRSRGQGATAAGANMRSRQVKLEVLARELRLGELEELLRRPLVGEDRLEHQVRQQPILRARALLFPAVAVRSFWAEAAAAHRRSGTQQRHPRRLRGLLPQRGSAKLALACLIGLCNRSARVPHTRPLDLHLPPSRTSPLECRAAPYAAYWRSAPAAPPSGGRRLVRT